MIHTRSDEWNATAKKIGSGSGSPRMNTSVSLPVSAVSGCRVGCATKAIRCDSGRLTFLRHAVRRGERVSFFGEFGHEVDEDTFRAGVSGCYLSS